MNSTYECVYSDRKIQEMQVLKHRFKAEIKD